ncbi:MAG: LacI family DNA-binding transcriptional regulator [Microbacterium sp.]|uniref:LacI family DNA-binding transcriptional regulator n=1 Tax=Microbacterium sp. TaxID=51671 RepID=UPI003BB01F45
MDQRPTSRDVARLAGVSQSTVSFVYTGRDGISDATRERVLSAAATLNYRPNLAARAMRTRRTGRLAVVIPVGALSPFSLLRGATSAAEEAGYVVEVVSLPDDPVERTSRLAELIDGRQHEGFLSFTPLPAPPGSGDGAPVVLSVSEFDDMMHVTGELTDAQPIVEMMERLVGLGHRRFLHVTGPLDFPAAVARRDAYVATVERLGLESLGVIEGDWSGRVGLDAVGSLPDSALPLALIAPNDYVAAGAIRAATLRGWSVPGDMSVTGWDDIGMSALLVPSLTSVVQDRERLGDYSMRRLIAALRKETPPERPTDFHRVVWRESIGAPRAR